MSDLVDHRLERDGAVATIVFDRPAAYNAVTGAMLLSLQATLAGEGLRIAVVDADPNQAYASWAAGVYEGAAGTVRARVREDGLVAVEMGTPDFDPASLPFDAPREMPAYWLPVDAEDVEFGCVSMGNPHAVLRVRDVATAPVGRLGPALERHPRFANRTNVGFMEIVGRAHIRLRVWERGVGETLACGTGACAAVAVGRTGGLLDAEVRVDLPGGTATVAWPGRGEPIWLTGPAVLVYSGSIDL